MNCTEFHDELMRATGALDTLAAHAASCPGCQVLLQAEMQLRARMRQLPPIAPSPGFEQRLSRAYARRPRSGFRTELVYALAASLLVAILIPALWLATPTSAPVPKAETAAAVKTQTVHVLFQSPRDLHGVQMRLELPQGVAFKHHPATQTVEWTVDLLRGANLLEFPITGTSIEPLVATLSYRNSQRRFTAALPAASASGQRRFTAALPAASGVPG